MREGTQRIVTALVGAPFVVGLTWLGGWWFGTLVVGAGWLGLYEFGHLVRREGPAPSAVWGYLLGTAVLVHPLLPEARLAGAVLVLALLATVPFWRTDEPLRRLESTVFGAVYPCLPISALLRLRVGSGLPQEEVELLGLTFGVLAMVWATDIGAYYTGRRVGRRGFFTEISPHKTWEGAAGGGIACLAVAGLLHPWILPGLGPAVAIGIAVGCAVLAQLGDLFMSRVKRTVEAKDSGRILPGHGGILDRIDGLLFAAPYVYVFLYLRAAILG